jgi:hypothetical protein
MLRKFLIRLGLGFIAIGLFVWYKTQPEQIEKKVVELREDFIHDTKSQVYAITPDQKNLFIDCTDDVFHGGELEAYEYL